MKQLLLITIFLWGCGSTEKQPTSNKSGTATSEAKGTPTEQHINLTILLDLSDRIDTITNPEKPHHYERDSTLIIYLTEYFLNQMKKKGTYLARGKMRVIFHPNPPDPGINQAAKKLNVDLSKMDPKGKKEVYETLKQTVAENISHIYGITLQQAKWPGSDIWRFFKNDVTEIAVDRDTSYRNLLVIFTDGYIYHNDSKDKEANRYGYILPDLFDKYKFRNDNAWEEKMDKLDFGLISKRSDLDRLEVLVLEITPSFKHKNDEDIIGKIMMKWFDEMKVKKYKIFNSDLPEYTTSKVENFLRE